MPESDLKPTERKHRKMLNSSEMSKRIVQLRSSSLLKHDVRRTREFLRLTLITSLVVPIATQTAAVAQTPQILQSRARSAGIAAGARCREGRPIDDQGTRKVIRLALRENGLEDTLGWLESQDGIAASRIILSAIGPSCSNESFTPSKQQQLGFRILPLLLDENSLSQEQKTAKYAEYKLLELQDYFNKASAQVASGDYQGSLNSHLAMLRLSNQVSITKPSLGSIYFGLGNAQRELGLLQESIKSLEQSESILLDTLGLDHGTTIAASVSLSQVLYQSGNKERGILKLQNLVDELERFKTREDLATMRIFAIRNLGFLYLNNDEKLKARSYFSKGIELAERVHGENSEEMSLLLGSLGFTYDSDEIIRVESDNKKKLEIATRLLSIERAISPDPSERLARAYLGVGTANISIGQHDVAISYIKQSLDMIARVKGKASPDYINHLDQLKTAHLNNGDIQTVLFLSLEALDLTEKVHGIDSEDYLLALSDLGLAYNSIGQHSKAYEVMIEAYNQFNKKGLTDPLLRRKIEISLRNTGKWTKAYKGNGLLAVYKSTLDLLTSPTASLLDAFDAGQVVYDLLLAKDYQRARNIADKSTQILEDRLGSDSPIVIRNKIQKASFMKSIKPRITVSELKALEKDFLNAFGTNDEQVSSFYLSIALAYWFDNRFAEQDEPLAKSVRRSLTNVTNILPRLADAQRLSAAATYGYAFDFAYTGAIDRQARAEIAYFAFVNRQGLAAEIERASSVLRRTKNKDTIDLLDEVNILNEKISSPRITASELLSLQSQKARLEIAINARLPEATIPIVTKQEISSSLEPEATLVEFQKYWRHTIAEIDEGYFYQAFILSPQGKLSVIDIGPAEEIDSVIRRLRVAIETRSPKYEEEREELFKAVVHPLEGILANSKVIYLTLGGELVTLPTSVLFSEAKSTAEIRLLSASRDLLRISKKQQSSQAVPVTFANPTFQSPLTDQVDSVVATTRGWSGDYRWSDLPATEVEGISVQKLIGGDLIMSDDATTRAVRSVRSPKILHIATHAFYFPSEKEITPPSLLPGAEYEDLDNPMARSGIVLAGANSSSTDNLDDGILTALELSSLDLSNTQLVTLSACETGRGDTISGEGVFGLQRALMVAGARSTLLSLWKVDDTATAAFMKQFYEQVMAGSSLVEALTRTQEYFRSHPIPAWSHPYYWAGFQLSGDWRPIQR